MPEKKYFDPKEESITQDPEEESITEDSKRTSLLINLKRALSRETLGSFRTLNELCAGKNYFWLFGYGI